MEYAIMEQLMSNCGRVVSHDEISLFLYNRVAFPFDRSIDTHITRIRRKLGDGRKLIVSVRGAGYVLCPGPNPCGVTEARGFFPRSALLLKIRSNSLMTFVSDYKNWILKRQHSRAQIFPNPPKLTMPTCT
jgi:Transcriptional regulatory protein, C terminal